jgi:RNase P subunit RPR2
MKKKLKNKIYKIGDKSKAICEYCKKLSETTFKMRTVPLSNGGQVENILVAVCDSCGKIVALPQQSVAQIRATIKRD